MDPQFRPMQHLFIWRLLLEREPVKANSIKPELGKADRDRLVAAGLISVDKRKSERGAVYVQLLDKGWEWANRNLDAALPPKSTAVAYVLQQVMLRLKHSLSADRTLADFFSAEQRPSPEPKNSVPDPVVQDRDISQRILAACRQLGDGVHTARIRIADLRSSLPDVGKGAFDESLRTLERSRQLVAYPLDNRQEIRPEDEDASVPNSSGEPRHIVYLQPTH